LLEELEVKAASSEAKTLPLAAMVEMLVSFKKGLEV
jgi:hypothetical protein